MVSSRETDPIFVKERAQRSIQNLDTFKKKARMILGDVKKKLASID